MTCGCARCPRSSSPTCSRNRSTSWIRKPGRSSFRSRRTPPPSRRVPPRSPSSCSMRPSRSPPRLIPVAITEAGQVTVTATLSGLGGVTLWDTDHPKLYHVTATLLVDSVAHAPLPGPDRLPRGHVHPRRVLPQRPPGQAVRGQPAPVLPVRRRRDARPGPGQGRQDHPARAELHHGPLRALPAVGGLLRRLRRGRAHGLGGGPRVGLPRRRRLAGARVPRHRRDDRPRPQPPVDHRLGRPPQRDPEQRPVLHQHERTRARPGRLAPDGGRDARDARHAGFRAGRVRRGRLLLRQGRDGHQGADAPAAGGRGRPAVPGQRGRRHAVRPGHLLPPHRPPGRPAGAGHGPRAGARPRRLRRPLLRPARLDRDRLPLRQR